MNTAISNSGMHSQPSSTVQKLASVNEQTWITFGTDIPVRSTLIQKMLRIEFLVGNLAEMMGDHDKAINSYESALRHNPYSILALSIVQENNLKE